MTITRRFLLKAGVAGGLCTVLPSPLFSAIDTTTMGVIADLHHGLAPTALTRLEAFMDAVAKKLPASILQLGDFNYGDPDSEVCTNLWKQFSGPKHHVLGNHDMDKFGKDHMLERWGMPHRYYSFDQGGFHFIILDRNNLKIDGKFTAYETANFYVDGKYRGFADDEQLEWLADDLDKTNLPTIVFSHQGLGMPDQVYPPPEANRPIENVLANANRSRTAPRVLACLCGHHHIDRYHFQDNIHYVWINSASYYRVGEEYGRMAPYTDPLFCFLTCRGDGTIEIEGRQSSWAEPTPQQRGYPDADRLTPFILTRNLRRS